MTKLKNELSKINSNGIVDELKRKSVELITDYCKTKLNDSKHDIAKYIEKQLERKIKNEIRKEVRKITMLSSAFVMFAIGGLFFLYGLFESILYFFELPSLFVNLSFSFFILIIGFIFYLNSN